MKLTRVLPVVLLFAMASVAMGDLVNDLGATFRLEADDLDAAYNDGDRVDSWTDNIGSLVLDGPNWPTKNPTLVALGDARPTFVADAANGHDLVRFNKEENTVLTSADAVANQALFSENAQTLAVVYSKQQADGMVLNMYRTNDASAGRGTGIGQLEAGIGVKGTDDCAWYTDGAWSFNSGGYTTLQNNVLYVQIYKIELVGSDLLHTLYVNGHQVAAPRAGGPALACNAIGVGATETNWRVTGDYLDGDIAEAIIFGSALSSSDISDLNAFLMDKYGIPEPATMVLLGLGGLALIRRKR